MAERGATAAVVAEVARVLRPRSPPPRRPAAETIAIRSASSEQNSIRSSASSTAARAPADVALARRQLGLQRAEHAEVLRLARVDRQLGRARELAPRGVALVAAERQRRAAQARVELGVAALAAAARLDLGRARSPSPSRPRRTRLGDRRARASLARRQRRRPARVRRRGDGERLLGAADEVQRLAEVHRRRDGHVLQVPAPRASVERAAQRRGALLDLAGRHERDAERVERADLVDVCGAAASSSACSASARAGDAPRGVARLQHQRLARLAREQAGALRARPVVGQQREPALERLVRLVRAACPERGDAACRRATRRGALGRLVDERERAPASVTERGSSSA